MSGQRGIVGKSILGKQGQVEVAPEKQGRIEVSGVFLETIGGKVGGRLTILPDCDSLTLQCYRARSASMGDEPGSPAILPKM